MKKVVAIYILVLSFFDGYCQGAYQFNGATGKYEYNTDPLGGMAQRYQNFTNMQMGTLQQMNNNITANNQLMQQMIMQQNNVQSKDEILKNISIAVAIGKDKIKKGQASNLFNWVFDKSISQSQKLQANNIKQLITSNELNTLNYAEVKAFFIITYYLVATGSTKDGKLEKKAEANRITPEYLANEYIQGMTDIQKTSNILDEINTLAKIAEANPTSEKAKYIAESALLNKGYAKITQLELTSKGLVNKQKIKKNIPLKTTFNRTAENYFIAEAIKVNKLSVSDGKKFQVYMDDFDALVKKIGGPNNDHAFGKSIVFMLYYSIYTDGKALTQIQIDSTLRLFYTNLINDETFQSSDNNTLQILYERNATEAMAISELYAIAKKDVDEFEKIQKNPSVAAMEKLSLASNTKVYDRITSVKTMAYNKLKQHFAPLNFDEYVLGKVGFVKK